MKIKKEKFKKRVYRITQVSAALLFILQVADKNTNHLENECLESKLLNMISVKNNENYTLGDIHQKNEIEKELINNNYKNIEISIGKYIETKENIDIQEPIIITDKNGKTVYGTIEGYELVKEDEKVYLRKIKKTTIDYGYGIKYEYNTQEGKKETGFIRTRK